MKRTPLEEVFYYIKIVSYSLAAIFAGYTVVDLHPKFLDDFTKVEYQICIIFVLAAGFFDFKIKEIVDNKAMNNPNFFIQFFV